MAATKFLGKVTVIIGASSEHGQATAIEFARQGSSVVLCGLDETRLKAVIGQCTEVAGGHADRFISVAGDINLTDIREAIIDKTIDTFGKLDILISCAAVFNVVQGIDDVTEGSYDQMFNTNVKAIFFLIQAAVKHLEKSGGNIVNVSSPTTKHTPIVYPMVKMAMDHMTSCLLSYLYPRGIRINTVDPSYVALRRQCENEAQRNELAEFMTDIENPNHPLHRNSITAESVAKSVAFVASDEAKPITGQHIDVENSRR